MDAELFPQMAEFEEVHWWFVGRRAIARSMIAGMKPPKDAQILEAGCGTGGNLPLLKEFGHVRGMELDDNARALAIKRNQCEVLSGRLPEEIPYGETKFDLIVLMDVLEHLEHDLESLKALRARTKPGGKIYITVPAHPFLWSHHDKTHHHFRRYVKSSLREVLDASGWHTRFLSYYNMWLFPPIAGIRLTQRAMGREASDLTLPSAPVNWLLTEIFSSEKYLLRMGLRFPLGVSLVVVAENRVE